MHGNELNSPPAVATAEAQLCERSDLKACPVCLQVEVADLHEDELLEVSFPDDAATPA